MCGYGALWVYTSSDPLAALRLRSELIKVLDGHEGWHVALPDASMIFAELVGNVVEHAHGPIRVTVNCDDRKLELRVEDQGPAFRYEPTLPAPGAEDGRGLFVVSKLAKDVRVESDPPWKAVVAELPAA